MGRPALNLIEPVDSPPQLIAVDLVSAFPNDNNLLPSDGEDSTDWMYQAEPLLGAIDPSEEEILRGRAIVVDCVLKLSEADR